VSAIRTRSGTVLRPTKRRISTQVQKHVLRLVRQVLEEAVRRELLATNPARLVRAAPVRRADVEDDWLRADELDVLLGCEGISLRDRTAYACAIGLALRLNDLKAIKVADVDLDAEVPGPHVTVRISKSDRIHRVPVLPWLAPWLRAHLETLPEGATWLFPTASGARYKGAYDFRWAPKRERLKNAKEPSETHAGALGVAGVERRIRFHDLRGTCATHLALGTWGRAWNLHEVQRMLAHADQRVTERYVRRAMDELAAAAMATPGGPSPRHVETRGAGETGEGGNDSPQSKHGRSSWRTQKDSNLRPSAPEADVSQMGDP